MFLIKCFYKHYIKLNIIQKSVNVIYYSLYIFKKIVFKISKAISYLLIDLPIFSKIYLTLLIIFISFLSNNKSKMHYIVN